MKDSIAVRLRLCAAVVVGMATAGIAVPSALKPAANFGERDVIVILKDQMPSVAPVRRAMGVRAAALASSQRPVIATLQQARARTVKSFTTINAFATRVSAAEAELLAAHPSVQAVVPDRILRQIKRPDAAARAGAPAGVAAAADAGDDDSSGPLCGTLEPQALQLTHTAFLDDSTPQAQAVRDGNGQPVTGTGVKVAFLADGLDTTVAGFTRPDGSPVFIDYQDFTGDPAGTPTSAGEAFGDASSIAAQDTPNGKPLLFDISQFVNAAHPLPSPCNIRIRGMAPGASLVGLKIFSNSFTTTSNFVQAIEYAVAHDVDVINESFGGNPYPDTVNDPTTLANAAAVKAGVVVTVSSGDAGSTGTLGSPSTDPFVINVGASTQGRFYDQTKYGAESLAHGNESNNISSFSSGGFAQKAPRTVDVVAPGDLGWALCSTNTALYNDCVSFASTATPIEDFGGTSESAPLTAGEAALIIQAYRSTHGGASPSPALVKKIIMSSATDINAPTSEQGAGLINSLAAVKLALSIGHGGGESESGDAARATGAAEEAAGGGIYIDSAGVQIVDEPNVHESRSFQITNTGSDSRHLTPLLQTLGKPFAGATLTLTLAPSTDPSLVNVTGALRPYIEKKFTVPAGADHLDASIAFSTATVTAYVYLSLFDPSGRQAIYSVPQGVGSGYAHVDVGTPAAGTWTAVIFTRPPTLSTSYAGPVQFTWAAEKFVKFGTVSPASLDLAPGSTQTVTASFSTPAQPGDLAAGLRFAAADDDSALLPDLPVTVRTLVPVGSSGGSFTGTLTGGNGRAGVGPYQTYAFDVPAGKSTMSLTLSTADSGYVLEGLLIDPQGMQLSVEPNIDPSGYTQSGLELAHYRPQAGRWQFVLVTDYTASGNETSLPYTADISFSSAHIAASGLPQSPKVLLSAKGKPVTATINVLNTAPLGELYFADARLTTATPIALPPLSLGCAATLPGACAGFLVPTQTSAVEFIAQSAVPITMDALNFVGFNVAGTGNPDVYAKSIGKDTVASSLSEPEMPYGLWEVVPSQIGPYPAAGAPTEPVAYSGAVLTQAFDGAVSADSGDLYADNTFGTTTFNPLALAPGASGTITLTFTPDPAQVGKVVSGYVYVDTFNPFVNTGDEVLRIPYSYTVAP